jgi:hypothetical protein
VDHQAAFTALSQPSSIGAQMDLLHFDAEILNELLQTNPSQRGVERSVNEA